MIGSAWRRAFFGVAGISAMAVVVFLLLNVGGWRARILTRLLRVDFPPLVVSPPPTFQPSVPAEFKVSVFARGFDQPRWLAVAPDGDVFVADSAAGEVIVLREGSRRDIPVSREVFVDHLNLPFGIAFHDDYVYVANTNEV
jgi:glucose/arabinose dehydrogenase